MPVAQSKEYNQYMEELDADKRYLQTAEGQAQEQRNQKARRRGEVASWEASELRTIGLEENKRAKPLPGDSRSRRIRFIRRRKHGFQLTRNGRRILHFQNYESWLREYMKTKK